MTNPELEGPDLRSRNDPPLHEQLVVALAHMVLRDHEERVFPHEHPEYCPTHSCTEVRSLLHRLEGAHDMLKRYGIRHIENGPTYQSDE